MNTPNTPAHDLGADDENPSGALELCAQRGAPELMGTCFLHPDGCHENPAARS
jgi:hypothetical protein